MRCRATYCSTHGGRCKCDTRTRLGSDNEVLAPKGGSTIMTRRRIKDEIPIHIINQHNAVHSIDNELRNLYGEVYNAISRSHIYRYIAERTGYCEKQIAYILNHTKMVN